MARHPIYGRDVIARTEERVGVRDDFLLKLAKEIVYSHHEHWDGSGYPEGLRGGMVDGFLGIQEDWRRIAIDLADEHDERELPAAGERLDGV